MHPPAGTTICPLMLSLLATSCATTPPVSPPAAEPHDACAALQTIGFDEIMRRAERRGLVRRVASGVSMDAPRPMPGRLYAQAPALMWVFQLTEEAIEAGVPQRAGAVIVAGCTEAVVAIWEMVRRRKPTCNDHYVACMDELGWTPGNHWKISVCGDCAQICRRTGRWPYKNTADKECPGAN